MGTVLLGIEISLSKKFNTSSLLLKFTLIKYSASLIGILVFSAIAPVNDLQHFSSNLCT